MVRHHSNRLSSKSVESCYNNVQHIFMGQRRCRLYCKKDQQSEGVTLIHIWTRCNMYSGNSKFKLEVKNSTKEGCSIHSVSFEEWETDQGCREDKAPTFQAQNSEKGPRCDISVENMQPTGGKSRMNSGFGIKKTHVHIFHQSPWARFLISL